MRRTTWVAVLVSMLALGVLAPVALADDNSIYQAYVSRDSDFTRLGNQLKKDIRAWVKSHRTKPAAALATIRDARGACSDVIAAMQQQPPSSGNGKKARVAAIASVKDLGASLGTLARGIKARTAHHAAKAKRLAHKSDALLARSLKEQKRARKFFKAAGVQVKP
jgi:hypothetical protein